MLKDINQLMTSASSRIIKGDNKKSLQTIQNSGTPFLNNKRIYAFSPDMDATNNGNDIPMNKKQNMYSISFQQNKTYASKNQHSQSCWLISSL